MRTYAILRAVLISTVFCVSLSVGASFVLGQDVGADVGGGAGIFRPKNPETKKKPKGSTPVTKP